MPHIDNSMQEIYRKALDADTRLDQLKSQGHGKFTSIFNQQTLFSIDANRFMPYVAEIADDIDRYKTSPEDESQLPPLLKKMEQLLTVLAQFKNITKQNQ